MTTFIPGIDANNESAAADPVHVLYVDHQKHPAPLSMCFHATASRRLASLVDRHPPTMTAEVDSAYCPQCLSFYDAAAAAQMGHCPKTSCKRCPVCQSIAAVSVDDNICFYKCGTCDWTSQSCDLSVQCDIDQENVTSKNNLEIVEKASEELASQLKNRTEQENVDCHDRFKAVLQSLQSMAKDHVKGLRSTTPIFSSSSAVTSKRSLDGGGPRSWSVQTLEESIAARVKLAEASLDETTGGQPVQIVSLEAEQPIHESLQGLTPESLLLQPPSLAISGSTVMNPQLLPLGVPLRVRKSRRDRAELAEGRPGILLKPKLNPLEGDSSLRTGHGNWWKKVG
jgi:dynactin 4